MRRDILDTKVLDDIIRSLGPIVGTDFNSQLLGLIDIALLPLAQVGCLQAIDGNVTEATTWADILIDPPFQSTNNNTNVISAIKQYMYINVKLLFDPPTSSITQILEKKSEELLYRIQLAYSQTL